MIFTGLALAAPQVVSKYAALDNLSLEALDEQLQVSSFSSSFNAG
jgi:hypothetical protein